jgi:hypothetical protein
MSDLLSYLTLRTFFVFFSTAFALLVVMLLLNIITVDEVIVMLKMSPEAANAFKMVVSRIQEVTGNITEIISQLLNKLLGWAGVDFDLSKIKIDTNQGGGSVPSSNPGASNPPFKQ